MRDEANSYMCLCTLDKNRHFKYDTNKFYKHIGINVNIRVYAEVRGSDGLACVRACVRACVHACVSGCACVCF